MMPFDRKDDKIGLSEKSLNRQMSPCQYLYSFLKIKFIYSFHYDLRHIFKSAKMNKLVTDVSQVNVFILAGNKIIAKSVDLFL